MYNKAERRSKRDMHNIAAYYAGLLKESMRNLHYSPLLLLSRQQYKKTLAHPKASFSLHQSTIPLVLQSALRCLTCTTENKLLHRLDKAKPWGPIRHNINIAR